MSVSGIYLKIKNDKLIIDRYNEIHNMEAQDEHGWAYHDWNHVTNVACLVERILTNFDYDEDFINSAKIACILHDTGALQGKDGHADRSFEFAKKYFEDNNIDFINKELVLEAIKIHSDGFETDNVIALALIFADKLDVTYVRIAEAGKQEEGVRQFCNVLKIKLDIINDTLKVEFITNNSFERKEFEEYYFTKKIFKAIETFSNKFNLKYKILFNGIEF